MTQASPLSRDVAALFQAAAVPADADVIVHTSFKNLSHEGFQPGDVVRALQDRLPQGTILMPAMSWRIVNAEHPVFDARSTPSHVGVVAETFRTRHASARSLHPTHSVSAFGARATHYTDDHHLDVTPCAGRSPFAKLDHPRGYVAMIDTKLDTCTVLHCAEEDWPDIYFNPSPETYTCLNAEGREFRVTTRRHVRDKRDFPKIAAYLEAGRDVWHGKLAGANFAVYRASALLRAARDLLKRDNRGLLLTAPRP